MTDPIPVIERHVQGAGAKFTRAVEHLHLLEQEIKWFDEGSPCYFRPEFDADTREYTIYIDKLDPVPLKLTAIIGDCVQNFRNCLDHLVAGIVRVRGGNIANTAFPICSRQSLFERAVKEGRLEGVPDSAVTFIKRLQPYERGDGTTYDPPSLWVLHEISNIDKHREILLTHHLAQGATLRNRSQALDFAQMLPTGPLEPGTPVARFSEAELERLDPEMHMHFSVPIAVAFQQIPRSQGWDDLGIDLGNDTLVVPMLTTIGLTVRVAFEWLTGYIVDPDLV